MSRHALPSSPVAKQTPSCWRVRVCRGLLLALPASQILDDFLRALCQGAIGVEIREGDRRAKPMVAPIDDADTPFGHRLRTRFLGGAGWFMPHAHRRLWLTALRIGLVFRGEVLTLDGRNFWNASRDMSATQERARERATTMGRDAAHEIRERAAINSRASKEFRLDEAAHQPDLAADAEALAQTLPHTRDTFRSSRPLWKYSHTRGLRSPLDGVQAVLATSANGARALAFRTARRECPRSTRSVHKPRKPPNRLDFKTVINAQGDAAALVECVTEHADAAKGVLLHATSEETAGRIAQSCRPAALRWRSKCSTASTPSPSCRDRPRALADGTLDGVLLVFPAQRQDFCHTPSRKRGFHPPVRNSPPSVSAPPPLARWPVNCRARRAGRCAESERHAGAAVLRQRQILKHSKRIS